MAGNIIEVRPLNGGWEVSERFEHLKFSTVKGALVYARFRLLLRPGEIRIFDATGTLVHREPAPRAGSSPQVNRRERGRKTIARRA